MLNNWKSVPGWCSDTEGTKLQELATNKLVLEIGTWKGKSAICMAATAKHVVAIDHFYGDSFAGASSPICQTWEFIKDSGLRNKVTLMTGNWVEVIPLLNLSNFEFMYYDADHTYEATKEFLDFALPLNIPLALHDYDNNPNHEGVKRAIDGCNRPITIFDRLAVL